MRCIVVAYVILLIVGCSALVAQEPAASQPVEVKPARTKPEASKPAAAQPAVPPPASTQPTTTRPATTQPVGANGAHHLSSGDPRVDEILDRLEAKGEAIKGLACGLTYRYVTVEPVEDAIVKEGELLYAVAKPNSKFYIHFDKMIAEGVIIPRDEYFLFDGEWLTERNDKAKTIIRRQIVRTGRKVDPFKLGKGPFPLPFGQNRDEILRSFKVTLRDFEIGNPPNTQHLYCVPLPGTELSQKYSRVDIFVDRRLELPTRIETERVVDGNRIEVNFHDVDVNEAPAMSRFQIETPADFNVSEEPLPPMPAGASDAGDAE